MKIYTKKGDAGETSLLGGKRVSKNNIRIEAYGTVDELNSWIGLIRASGMDQHTSEVLISIQEQLFVIGALMASDPEKTTIKTPELKEEDILRLEDEMDSMNENLPELRSFMLPGGHRDVSHCHIARCVCRRAERMAVALQQEGDTSDISVKYLNRLSDYLFVLARMFAHDLNVKDVVWEPEK